jgi:hypothetical protein
MYNKVFTNIYSIFSKIFDFLSMRTKPQKTDNDNDNDIDSEETVFILNKMHMGL